MKYLGIDVGGTNIAVGIVDENDKIVAKVSNKTPVPCTEDVFCDCVAKTAYEAMEKAGVTLADLPWIGLGCPGTINRATGVVEFSNNLGYSNFPVKKMLEERFEGKEVIIENDANAAAYGEYQAGALKGADNAVAITLGTGVGSGIIIDHKIYAGNNFAAGEMGHHVIVFDGRQCTCGRKGCWERYASATGLIITTKEAMEKADKDAPIWKLVDGDINRVSGRTAFDAMRAGDPVGQAVVDEYIAYLGCGIVNVINTFQPDILCIGGGICNEGETLLAPLREYVEKEQYAMNSSKKTVMCRAELGNDAGIIGAALLGK
ncbi:MAG TPA: ROK family protein [Candidatus Gallacutalibacter pullistercoris]|nr:ROK family protein [Candidatus Gallacutalibacter pullistercoris]